MGQVPNRIVPVPPEDPVRLVLARLDEPTTRGEQIKPFVLILPPA